MPAAETVPFDSETGCAQFITKSLRSDIRQELVPRSMALKDRRPFASLEQRGPFLCGEERSGQLDEPGIGLRGSEHHVTSKHCALGKSSENDLTRICAEFVFDFLEEPQ